MRVYGPNGTAVATAPASARRAAGGGFSIDEGTEAPRNTGTAGSLRSVASVDALIALQGVEDPTERKKRAVTKGRRALDLLEALKLGLLDGNVDPSMLSRLKVAADGLNDGSGDPSLDALLGEIDLRVAVELAKAGIR
jgi:Class II flagellar assembly regulator